MSEESSKMESRASMNSGSAAASLRSERNEASGRGEAAEPAAAQQEETISAAVASLPSLAEPNGSSKREASAGNGPPYKRPRHGEERSFYQHEAAGFIDYDDASDRRPRSGYEIDKQMIYEMYCVRPPRKSAYEDDYEKDEEAQEEEVDEHKEEDGSYDMDAWKRSVDPDSLKFKMMSKLTDSGEDAPQAKKASSWKSESWTDMYARLKRFVETNGHWPSFDEDHDLNLWMDEQRRIWLGKRRHVTEGRTAEHRKLLDDIFFPWTCKLEEEANRYSARLKDLEVFLSQNGGKWPKHTETLTKANGEIVHIGSWVHGQRKAYWTYKNEKAYPTGKWRERRTKMMSGRIAKLEAMEIDWNERLDSDQKIMDDLKWMECFNDLKNYLEKNNGTWPTYRDVMERSNGDIFRVGKWVSKQRKSIWAWHRCKMGNSRVTNNRIEMLASLDFRLNRGRR